MQIINTELAEVLILKPRIFKDDRGYLYESYRASLKTKAGIDYDFVQENISMSYKHVLRGLHLQKTQPQGKLIQVIDGAIFDVAVDVRPESKQFGQYTGIHINSHNHHQLWIPPGFAHGFCTLSEKAIVHYKCTDYYNPNDEAGIAWNCPKININWPISTPILSNKDKSHPTLTEYIKTNL